MKKYIYGIYDMKNNEQCVGIFDSIKEVGEYFNKSRKYIETVMYQEIKIDSRYMVIRIKKNF